MFGLSNAIRGAVIGMAALGLVAVSCFVLGYRYRGATFDAEMASLQRQAELDNRAKNDALAELVRQASAAADEVEQAAKNDESRRLEVIEASRRTPSAVLPSSDIVAINRMIEGTRP